MLCDCVIVGLIYFYGTDLCRGYIMIGDMLDDILRDEGEDDGQTVLLVIMQVGDIFGKEAILDSRKCIVGDRNRSSFQLFCELGVGGIVGGIV
jgi:hypothetical protein